MAQEVAGRAGKGREAHVIYLGGVYCSGPPEEVRRHVLELWPVTEARAPTGVTSWSLNGNHDMYSGGYGYYDTLLADPRFAAQHSGGQRWALFGFAVFDLDGERIQARYLDEHGATARTEVIE